MNRRTIVTAIVILIASILAPLQIDAAEQATPTPSSPEFVESDGDDDGGEPAVKPRTPEVRNVIVNMHASGGQWSNAEGNLQNHNLVKTRLVIQRDLLKYALDDNPDRFSRRRLAEKNNEIRLHLNSTATLVDKIDKKYEQYEKDWHTLDNLYLKHLPEGHPDKILYRKRSINKENKKIRSETLLDLSMKGDGDGDDGDDAGGEPAVKPRTPEVMDAIRNLSASGGQWNYAKGNLRSHNIITAGLATQRDLLKYGLDDNTYGFSRRRLAEKNNEIRLHLKNADPLVDEIDTTYELYEKNWNTLNDLIDIEHLPEGHPDKIRFEKMGNTEENRVIHPETLLDLSMSCKNGCGVSFANTGNSLAAFEAAVNAHYTGICNVKPHNGLRYYDCPDKPGSCPVPREHYIACRGGCGTPFPPRRVVKDMNPIAGYISVVSHVCNQTARVGIRGSAPCGNAAAARVTEGYNRYTCGGQTTCSNDEKHLSTGDGGL